MKRNTLTNTGMFLTRKHKKHMELNQDHKEQTQENK